LRKQIYAILIIFLFSLTFVYAQPVCTDSETGHDKFVPGTVTWQTNGNNAQSFPDNCLLSTDDQGGPLYKVQEHYCSDDDKKLVDIVNCPTTCSISSNGEGYCTPDDNIPEFSTVAAGISLAGAAAGFMFLRKRR
jgi:hypothetical protein